MRYTHPILWEKNIPFSMEIEYILSPWHKETIIIDSKEKALALWFQPVEETKTDWIDEDTLLWYVKQTTDTFRNRNGHSFIRCDIKRLKLLLDKHQPKSDVCNLVPLDTKKIADELQPLSFKDGDWYACTSISNVLSIIHKYGTTPQKKYSRKSILEYCKNTFAYPETWEMHIYAFLKDNNLLED